MANGAELVLLTTLDRYKLWMGGARTKVRCDEISAARLLLERALSEVPSKTKAMVVLEQSRVEEYSGNLNTARTLLEKAKKDFRHEWKVCAADRVGVLVAHQLCRCFWRAYCSR